MYLSSLIESWLIFQSVINNHMQFDNKYTLTTDCYHAVEHPKDLIVLHFTAGHSGENAAQWFASQRNRVSTPFVVEHTGTIFQLYDPKYWSFHLGIKGTHAHDRRSIGIEIANIGPLKLKKNVLHSWPRDYSQIYCDLNQTDRYVKASYRGFDYYAVYTAAQMQAVAKLTQWLCEEFKIPYVIPTDTMRTKFDLTYFSTYQGIASHQNFRSDKFDVGPAFDWNIFEQADTVAEPEPAQPKETTTWQTISESVRKVFNKSNNQKDS